MCRTRFAATGSSRGRSARRTPRVADRVTADAGRQPVTVAVARFLAELSEGDRGRSTTAITWRLFPRQYPDVHEIQGGEQKTHTIVRLVRSRPRSPPERAGSGAACAHPLVARADPAWYCASGARPVPGADRATTRTRRTPRSSTPRSTATDTFERKRETASTSTAGGISATSTAITRPSCTTGPAPFVSHYNNQYDPVAGFALPVPAHAATSAVAAADGRARRACRRHRHLSHRPRQSRVQRRAVLAHRIHYVDAGHCDAPLLSARDPSVCGGGPSAEHNYTTGLMLHHSLTGDPLSRETAIGLARWVIDDGRRHADRSSAGSTAARPGLPARAARRSITARDAAPRTRSPR